MKTLNLLQSLIIVLLLSFSSLYSQQINCLDCHENVVEKSAHNKVIKCDDCHRDIKSEEHEKGVAKSVDCGKCHELLASRVQNDVHHNIMNVADEKAPSCKTCHGTHHIKNIKNIDDKFSEYCKSCHKKNVFKVQFHNLAELNKDCNICHDNNDYNKELEVSVHKNLACSNCHSYVVNNLENHQKNPKEGRLADCYLCHNLIAEQHRESIHGISLAEGIDEAAQCWNCHGSHNILPISENNSKAHFTNLVKTCGECHDNPEFSKKHLSTVKEPGKMYSKSIHGKLVELGSENAATCTKCHGVHDIKNRIQPFSKISSINIPGVCSECHKQITDEYYQSIHWVGVKKGVKESPSCNDCHSEHNIHAVNTIDKRIEIKKIQDNTCLQCHQNLLLSERYGLDEANALNYQDSYHGLAVSRGDTTAAMCVDCHGVHKILPKSHAESSINKNNIVETCKTCHKKANDVFSNSYSHTSESNTSAKFIESIVEVVYFWIIIIVIGGMLIHNLIIFVYELRERRKSTINEIKIPRFTNNELIQHLILLISFLILAITGFQLKYPDSWWSIGLQYIGLDETNRQLVHRISAVVMIALSVYHVIYLLFTERGRDVLKGLAPAFSDFKLAFQNIFYHLNLTKKHPEFDNYNYIEKLEYWALVWGTLVMGLTGFILWFPTVVGSWAPLWIIKVSEIVHFYEAILATLAIVVWHWFFVMLRPKEYPVSFAVVDGKITFQHYKDEHKLKFKKIVIEWLELKSGKRKKLSNFATLFISSIRKSNIEPESFFMNEINNDESFKQELEKRNLGI